MWTENQINFLKDIIFFKGRMCNNESFDIKCKCLDSVDCDEELICPIYKEYDGENAQMLFAAKYELEKHNCPKFTKKEGYW